MVKTVSTLVSQSGFPPGVSEFRNAHSGPAQGLKSNTQVQSSSSKASCSKTLGSPWVCAMNVFLYFVAKELHLKKVPVTSCQVQTVLYYGQNILWHP